MSVNQLIVTWQDTDTKRYFPVAKLSLLEEAGESGYLFVYTKGFERAAEFGFRPFEAFPDVGYEYQGTELFPFFANRLIPESRKDRDEFVRCLGLDPDTASPLDVLARSGGRRATDSVEIIAFPEADASVCNVLRYFFPSHGLRHMPDFAEDYAKDLRAESPLYLMHDMQNPVDPKALLLRTEDNCPVGFLPRYLLEDTWLLLNRDEDVKLEVFVEKVNPPPHPVQQRLLCKMIVKTASEFRPCSGGDYEPLLSSNSGPVAGVR